MHSPARSGGSIGAIQGHGQVGGISQSIACVIPAIPIQPSKGPSNVFQPVGDRPSNLVGTVNIRLFPGYNGRCRSTRRTPDTSLSRSD
jgi:hypothetical protein